MLGVDMRGVETFLVRLFKIHLILTPMSFQQQQTVKGNVSMRFVLSNQNKKTSSEHRHLAVSSRLIVLKISTCLVLFYSRMPLEDIKSNQQLLRLSSPLTLLLQHISATNTRFWNLVTIRYPTF